MKVLALLILTLAIAYAQNEPGAIWMPSPHKNSRNGYSVKWLIIHGTAGGSSAEAIGNWFQNPQSQAATHYVVGQDGTVVQCVNENEAAWGNGRVEAGADTWWTASNPSPNQVTISIEHVKPSTDNSDLITPAQRDATFVLIRNILARNPGIKAAWADGTGGITGHFSVSPPSRERCPGPFVWEELFTELNGSTLPICMGTVTADSLNIRTAPNSGSIIVGSLPSGRVINMQSKVTGETVNGDSDWYRLHDGSGYVAGYYIRVHINQPSWC